MTTESGTYKFEPVHGEQMDQQLRSLKSCEESLYEAHEAVLRNDDNANEQVFRFRCRISVLLTEVKVLIADEEDKLNERT
jgi:hypothetical protein